MDNDDLYEEPETPAAPAEQSHGVFWFGLVFTLLASVCGGAFLYSQGTLSTREIPEPFHKQLADLNRDRVELAKKRQDLQKEIAALDAQDRWDCERENSVAGEALQALNFSNTEYHVDVDKMKIVPVHTH